MPISVYAYVLSFMSSVRANETLCCSCSHLAKAGRSAHQLIPVLSPWLPGLLMHSRRGNCSQNLSLLLPSWSLDEPTPVRSWSFPFLPVAALSPQLKVEMAFGWVCKIWLGLKTVFYQLSTPCGNRAQLFHISFTYHLLPKPKSFPHRGGCSWFTSLHLHSCLQL